MNVLVLNCGSSTAKFQLIATDLDHIARDADEHLAGGVVERIGGEAIITFGARGAEARRSTAPVRDTRAAVETIIRWVTSADSGIREVRSVADIHAVGHRVVHGGERFTHSVLIDDAVLRGIEGGQTNIITLHLGNGCSAAAIKGGDSVDTSMGMTPLEGLVMGTRSGDVDPALLDFIGAKEGLSGQEVDSILN